MSPNGDPAGAADAGSARRADEIIARMERVPFSRFHLRLAVILGFGNFFDAYDSLAIAAALAVIFRTMHIGFVNVGILLSSAYVGQFIGANLIGYFCEVRGRRPAYIIAMIVFGVCSLVSAFSWNFGSLLVVRFIEGLGLGAEVPVTLALFNEYIKGSNRGLVFTIYQSSFAWGLGLTPLIAAGLFSIMPPEIGWRVLFALGGIPILVAIYAVSKLPESVRWLADKRQLAQAETLVGELESQFPAGRLPEPETKYRADIKPTRFGEMFTGIYRRRTILSWTQWFTTYFTVYGYAVWLPTLFVRIGHLPVTSSLLLSAVANLCQLAMAYITAWMMDRVGRKPTFIMGYAIVVAGAAFGVVAVGLLHNTGWPILFIAGLAMGVGGSVNAIDAGMYASELYPTRMRAWGTATGSSLNRVASFIAPTLVGVLLAAKMGLVSVFGMFLIVAAAGLVVMAALGIETKHRVLEELSA